jgi:hypothetical protein
MRMLSRCCRMMRPRALSGVRAADDRKRTTGSSAPDAALDKVCDLGKSRFDLNR